MHAPLIALRDALPIGQAYTELWPLYSSVWPPKRSMKACNSGRLHLICSVLF